MTAEIIRRRSEPSGSIIEAAYCRFQFSYPKAANENRHLAPSGMSPTETEIITHLAAGKNAAAVADLVKIDEAAVKEHIRFILRKLKTRTTPPPSGRPVSK
ncbi:LuxR C-terminal-related transcriptional regulator [Microvirga sp. M2]|uniref:LuxR C-terminal-related transcriptional regulator n=1 Tax=Microvirga sp. M2 TaxID=3073270 RepID=UPI0039C43E15